MAATVAAAVAGAVVLAALVVGAGLLLTRELLHGRVGDWDVEVTSWLVARRTPVRDDLSEVGSQLAGTATVIVVVGLVLTVLAWRRHFAELGLVAIAIAVEGAIYAMATFVVTRHRPPVPRLENLIVADSYFSGHTAAAVAVYGSVAVVVWRLARAHWLRGLVVAVAVVVPAVVAVSRMYRGMHYASDAVVGAFVGLGCVVIAVLAVRVGERLATYDEGCRETVAEPMRSAPVGVAS